MARKANPAPARPNPSRFDNSPLYANPAQVGGIETSVLDDGPARGTRIAWVNTGSGLIYKILIDRGLDIADAFFNGRSLTWLAPQGFSAPNPAGRHGGDWLNAFGGGLVTSCGPLNAGAPCEDHGQSLPLHGTHSNTPATFESIIQPDPHQGRSDFSITGIINTARLFGPNLQLRRTILGRLGQPSLTIRDQFTNRGHEPLPHAWLLHINLGWPLLDKGARLHFNGRVIPRHGSENWFARQNNFRVIPSPQQAHRRAGEAVAYVQPAPARDKICRVALTNRAARLGVSVQFNTTQFPRWVLWQHFAPAGEYVMAIEPANCGVEGRDVDRQRGWLDHLQPGQTKIYDTTIAVADRPDQLRAMELAAKKK